MVLKAIEVAWRPGSSSPLVTTVRLAGCGRSYLSFGANPTSSSATFAVPQGWKTETDGNVPSLCRVAGWWSTDTNCPVGQSAWHHPPRFPKVLENCPALPASIQLCGCHHASHWHISRAAFREVRAQAINGVPVYPGSRLAGSYDWLSHPLGSSQRNRTGRRIASSTHSAAHKRERHFRAWRHSCLRRGSPPSECSYLRSEESRQEACKVTRFIFLPWAFRHTTPPPAISASPTLRVPKRVSVAWRSDRTRPARRCLRLRPVRALSKWAPDESQHGRLRPDRDGARAHS